MKASPVRARRIETGNGSIRQGASAWARRLGTGQWRVVIDAPRPAALQMERDVRLAEEAVPTLRLFTWSPPAISLGWKQSPPPWLGAGSWQVSCLEQVERPTGGGIAFHGSDVSVSLVLPSALGFSIHAVMRAVCFAMADACRSFGADIETVLEAGKAERITYCLTQENPYALRFGGKKLAGFALRRYRKSLLVQGSLLVRRIPERLEMELPREVASSLNDRAIPLAELAREYIDETAFALRAAERWGCSWGDFLLEERACEI